VTGHDVMVLIALIAAAIAWWGLHVRALFRLWAREDKEREGN
jgi:hypothetical protein